MARRLEIVPTDRQTRLGLGYLLVDLFVLPPVLSGCNEALGAPLGAAALNLVYYCVNFAAVVAILHPFLRDSLAHGLRAIGRTLLIAAAALGCYYILNFLVTAALVRLRPDFYNANDRAIASMARQDFFLVAAGTVLLVPLTEEALFRALIFGRLHRRSVPLAYVLSAAAFAAIHILGYLGAAPPWQLALCFVQYLPAGFCLAAAYDLSGSLLPCVLMHAVINAVGLFLVR